MISAAQRPIHDQAAEDAAFARISAILARHVGQANAITIDAIAIAAGLTRIDGSGRIVPQRRIVEHILETRFDQFPFLLVSGAEGYWQPTDAADLNRYDASLQSRLVKLCLRRRTLRRKAPVNGFARDGKRYVRKDTGPLVQTDLDLFGRAP